MEIKQIRKRNGKKVDFVQDKITEAVFRAGDAVARREGKVGDRAISQRVSDRVVGNLEHMFGGGPTIPNVEQVQDVVEKTLIQLGYEDTAKAYILYREKHKERRELNSAQKEVFNFARRLINDYIKKVDWRGQENSNSGQITFQGANARLAGDLWNTFALHEMYGTENPEIAEAHKSGQLHIHDLDFPTVAYCCGHSLEQLLKRGFGEVKERVQSSPAKHLRSVVNQMVNYIGTMQGEFAGAQAFSSVDTFLAPFVRVDNLSYEEVKQSMQELVYGLNVPSRWGWQAPFSNLTFDLTVPKDLANKKVLSGLKKEKIELYIERERQAINEKYNGLFPAEKVEEYLGERRNSLEKMLDSRYGEYQKEMNMINKAYLELKLEGDKAGRIFTFPIDTYNLTKDFDWDSEISDLLFEVTGKYGIPYFQNYLGSNLDPGAIRAMCCRLNIDQKELMKRPGSLWGPGDSTGSIGVVTINMNRLGYEAHNEDEYFKMLGHRMDLAMQSLEIKRKRIAHLLKEDFVPFTKSYLGHFKNHFSTIGLVGMHEGLVNFLKQGIDTEKGQEFAIKTLDFMREKLKEYQEKTGNLYNLEATPAEGASYRLAKLDKETYPHIYTSGEKEPYLTNSTQLPVSLDIDLFSALKHQEPLQTRYTGGTIFHTFLGESMSGAQAKKLVRKIAENTTLPYFSLTPVFSICEKHNYISGNKPICPKCGAKTEVYDRVVGYIRPTGTMNPGKQEEQKDRRRFPV
ncbi:ribonucleoside triphosphate reductase [Candidatus Pacearchaeota archaeon CG06_land_8_20_14_3_00_35_12]|nr:MAG: ribonucleoside triphosphate reductase [Candidatus Pacearchaeota archaeon CG06_land_8_20_14_3_00_35_12]